jgi:hypothetical protein
MQLQVDAVVERIFQAAPADHARLLKCVRAVRPLNNKTLKALSRLKGQSIDKLLQGTPITDVGALWVRHHQQRVFRSTKEGYVENPHPVRGINWRGFVLVDEFVLNPFLVLAHEFGHAVTTESDLAEQGSFNESWNDEMAAWRYVHHWGFDEELKPFLTYAENDRHHCSGPGKTIEIDGERFVVTDDFLLKHV